MRMYVCVQGGTRDNEHAAAALRQGVPAADAAPPAASASAPAPAPAPASLLQPTLNSIYINLRVIFEISSRGERCGFQTLNGVEHRTGASLSYLLMMIFLTM